ncbi:hypothetical protein Pfo_007532 [Paulownia fortunei]|nr:hypothetical protein Pfo_007532 [Paulownia fortunei]
MGVPTRQNVVLKVVHPGRNVEVFREPITAGELMRKYPRHCIARPDVFEFPWIVVHPESVLVLGKVFYLVPYHTMDNLLKAKRQQQQPLLSSKHNQSSKLSHHFLDHPRQDSPMKSLAGGTPKHQQHDRYYKRQSYHRNVNDQESCEDTQGQDSDTGILYKQEFYKSWNKMRRNLNQPQESYYDQLDSPFDSSRPCFSMMRSGRPRGKSPENSELLRLKPCLRKPDSSRKKLNLKVSFASPVVIPSYRRRPADDHQDALVLQV